jgi:ferredoxin
MNHLSSICFKTLARGVARVPTTARTGIRRSFAKIVFYESGNDNKVEVEAPIGKTLLDIAIDNNIDIEGACGGELACSTCHVIVSQELFDKLPAKKEEEEDMLDLAWGLTDT